MFEKVYLFSLSRYIGGENYNVEVNYVVDGGVGIINGFLVVFNVWLNMEDLRRYLVGEYWEYGLICCFWFENFGIFD